MVQLKLNKLIIIDVAVIAVVILFVAVGGIYFLRKPSVSDSKLKVTVEISDQGQVNTILLPAQNNKVVYLNSVDVPVTTIDVRQQNGVLEITVKGSGYIEQNGDAFFNGQRILIGQKAEIHANYFAQGKIIKIENAN